MTTFESNLKTVIEELQARDVDLQNQIDNEVAARSNADAQLKANIDSEVTSRIAADEDLQDQISKEVLARIEGDKLLQTNIDAEVTARTDADTRLQISINSETDTRKNVDKDLQEQIDALNIAGTIQYFARKTAPNGWLKADGSAISRTQYAKLFTAIGTMFGAGDGSTTFNLPDMRGEFIRGFDDGRGVDAGRLLGSAQKGTLSVNDPSLTQVTVTSLISADDTNNLIMNQRVGLDNPVSMSDYTGLNNALYNPASSYQSVITNPFAFNFGVTRPRNIALLACIKY